ncbi:putative tyrosine recombinase [Caulobacter phage C1]|nr:putative tyrosine recombinase [Caulobacter phage C1]UTU08440.1 putative tyrosine recombinase [Caulobacter phage C2]UTU08957.1 putative tyrosine recombinase [Caulobacter phage J4]UTU09515.1 putative tyrosine recombinase [Caulobacter phage BL47]UTU10073.1 putative tyrosine recombinase [Caulobacter phage RB23]WGN97108.1 putative tyrosine recombinase [Bertelyvirus sp.]
MRKTSDPTYLSQLRALNRPSSLATPVATSQAVSKKGASSRAQVLTPDQFHELRGLVDDDSKTPERDLVGVLLSFYCGLRAQEIAYLEWHRHILNARGGFRTATINGETVNVIFISGDIGKRGRERTLPMPAPLLDALKALRRLRPTDVYVFHRLDCPPGYGPLTANAVAQWFKRIYTKYEYEGCSSHSGRRTFITQAARRAQASGCSLRDVQEMAGHSSLVTTQTYIEVSERQASLVAGLYDDAPRPSPRSARQRQAA